MYRFSLAYCLFFFLFIQSYGLYAQADDTLRVMAYNLLNYENNSISGCSNTNNSSTTKESGLSAIVGHTLPDILVVNEVGTSTPAATFNLLRDALNDNGRNYYGFTTMQVGQRQTNNSSSTGNLIYWDTRILELHSSNYIEFDPFNRALVRVIDHFTLYYKDPNLGVHNDTVFLHIFAAHLKAGNNTADQNERDWATEAVMAYLDSNQLQGNVLMAGDLNLYRSAEAAYQNMLAYYDTSLRFYDPLSIPGVWSNNSPYAIIHTQSTRSSGGCGAGGGMDDRFDFILASDEVMNGTDSLRYITNSYQAVGQDGQHFNSAINASPTNTSVPPNVLQALVDVSDHLPVMMDMEISLPSANMIEDYRSKLKLSFQNPTSGSLSINFEDTGNRVSTIELLSTSGRLIKEWNHHGGNYFEESIENLPNGLYFLRFVEDSGSQEIRKIIKN